MIKGVKLVTVPVRIQDEAVKFYTEKLGFEKTTDAPFMPNARWIEVKPPEGGARLVLFPPMEGQEDRIGSFQPIVFTADDVEKTYRELTARGVEFTQLGLQRSGRQHVRADV
jgi:catechol 2,3-dioxygenase-like lactoylglutathione lyase family enzyme